MEYAGLHAQYDRIKDTVNENIQKVLDQGQYILGPEVAQLESQLAARAGSKHSIACSSGTDTLLIALLALGIGNGDEVITAPFTFIATAEMIALAGARPVFVDIDPATYNLDPNQLEQAITPRTRAIMPVSMFGQCPDIDAINAIAARHSLPVIEDAAQSFGATYKGRPSCNLSTIGCTSFFPSKPLGCYGDGGACFTNDDALASAMRQIGNHGQSSRYHHTAVGINGRLDSLQAAILLSKLSIFSEELTLRSAVAERYNHLLGSFVETPQLRPGCTSTWAQYTIQVDHREAVLKSMTAAGIPTAVHYPRPLHLQPVFAHLGLGPGSYPHAERASDRVMSLPMHPYLEESDQIKVAEALKSALT